MSPAELTEILDRLRDEPLPVRIVRPPVDWLRVFAWGLVVIIVAVCWAAIQE